jgi:beta-lactamase class D
MGGWVDGWRMGGGDGGDGWIVGWMEEYNNKLMYLVYLQQTLKITKECQVRVED